MPAYTPYTVAPYREFAEPRPQSLWIQRSPSPPLLHFAG